MKRREFMAAGAASASAVLWPQAARAQQADKVIRIGFFGASLGSSSMAANYKSFVDGLRDQGFSESPNLILEFRQNDDPRGPFAQAAELMRLEVDLIVATGPEVVMQAVVGASRSIPIVILAVQYDPVERGYAKSLSRPGGNITGISYRQPELAAKQLELLTQAFPDKRRLAILWDAPGADQFGAAELAAKSMPLDIRSHKLEKPPYDFAAAFRAMAEDGAQMVQVLSSPHFVEYRPQVAEAAIRHRLPTMFVFRSYVDAGGLMSYGVDQIPAYRQLASYVAKILKGTNPADLPIEQASKFELVVNLKTAKAIGIEIPTSILLRADVVIE
jgi:putative ABC transport system substrate-binding protein